MHMDVESRRTVRLSGKLIAVNRPPARCEDVIFVTSTFHMSMESSFGTQSVWRPEEVWRGLQSIATLHISLSCGTKIVICMEAGGGLEGVAVNLKS